MPRKTRMRSYGGSGGGGIDLGAILQAAYGQPQVNTQFDEGNILKSTNNPKLANVKNPYVGNNLFNRDAASKLNTEYRIGQLESDAETKRKLDEAQKMVPIKTEQEKQIQGVLTGAEGERQKIVTKEMRDRAVTDLLRAEGLIDTPENRRMFDNVLAETRIAVKQAQAGEEASKAELGRRTSESAIGIGRDTSDLTRNTALNRAILGQKEAQEAVSAAPAKFGIERRLEEMKPAEEIAKIRYMGAGGPLREAQATRAEFGDPTQRLMNQLIQQKLGGVGTTPSVLATPGIVPPSIDPNFEYIHVDGKLFKVAKKQL